MISTLIEELALWGCDTEGALIRLSGDEELYIECVRGTAAELGNLTNLTEAVKACNAKQAFEIAHYFKGAAANLGLTPLVNLLSEASEAFRSGSLDGSDILLDKLIEQSKHLNYILFTETAGAV